MVPSGSSAADGRPEGRIATGVCANCSSARPSPFCPQCGQNDRNYVRGLGSMVWEFGREAFELDSRTLRTLKLLLFKPGSLTSEFSRNRRAGYTSPIRLYLFTSFLFVLILSLAMPDSWSRGATPVGDDPEGPAGDFVRAPGTVPGPPGARGGEPSYCAEGTASAGGTGSDDILAAAIDAAAGEGAVEALSDALEPAHARRLHDILGRPDSDRSKRIALVVAGLAAPDADDRAAGRPVGDAAPERRHPLGSMLLASVVDLLHDPEVFAQRAVGNLPVAMFFLLPCLALALGVCYRGRRRFFVEHLVFGMHNQTFTFLCLAAAFLVPTGPVGRWFLAFFVAVPQLYCLMALRRYYGDGWVRTLLKGAIVWWLYMLVLLPGLLFVLFLTA